MMDAFTNTWLYIVLECIAIAFIVLIGLSVIAVIALYVIDRTQRREAVRRNYPVIGRFRGLFEHLGEFFRQYFFAMDREELPFNRAERGWVYRAAKNEDSTVAFGSTRDLKPTGSVFFVNCPYPTLDTDAAKTSSCTIGPHSRQPYTTNSLINISGMSYGAISKPAIQALSRGAKKAGVWMNTGEGGLSPFHLEGGCDIVFQIGTGKFGVQDKNGHLSDEKLKEIARHEQVKMFELKLSQGAKPGKGGMLPAAKVTAEIAAIRNIPVGEAAISPNRHPEINSASELLDMLSHIRDVTGKPVGFKCVMGAYGWLDELFQLIVDRGLENAPDFITIDSADGGTGAAPMSLMDYVGLPIQESLPLVVDKMKQYGIYDRIKVIASGKLTNPSMVAWAICMGADFVVTARGFMFSLGCIQALKCNKNTCPTGITTHDPRFQRGLVVEDKAERVAHYAKNLAYEVGVIAHSCGVKEPRGLERYHARIMCDSGRSVSLEEAFPADGSPSPVDTSSMR